MSVRAVPENPPGTLGLRRDPALVPLSQDHHAALVQAQALTRAAAGLAPYEGPAAGTARGFLAFRQAELLGHFDDEETVLFPAASRVDPAATERVRAEHAEMDALAASLELALDGGRDPRPIMAQLGSLLHDHVRFEERAWFESLQARLPAAELARIGRELEARREARGRGPGCALPPRR
ncbi:MAG TPA: hemerythrin domain-containing protein [Vicinamibacteria bacterium]|nr:hemerythrin domain-containing protein [Vicinamibacteria bacterium]